jgi:hypothetical protein
MSRRRFAPRSFEARSTASLQSLLDRTPGARAPMDVAVQLAHEVLRAAAEVHAEGRTLGPVDAASFEVSGDGALSLRGEAGGTDVLEDVQAVGAVLYQVFTGLTPAQARARLQAPRLDEVPAPSRFNPALDDTLDALVASMLAADAAQRPQSLAHLLAVVRNVMDDLGLEVERAVVARWAGFAGPKPRLQVAPVAFAVAAPAPKAVPPVAAPVPKTVPHRLPPRGWQTSDAEDSDCDEADDVEVAGWAEPVRFDGWAVLAACFAMAVLAMAFTF